jgi:hypothetical protein
MSMNSAVQGLMASVYLAIVRDRQQWPAVTANTNSFETANSRLMKQMVLSMAIQLHTEK